MCVPFCYSLFNYLAGITTIIALIISGTHKYIGTKSNHIMLEDIIEQYSQHLANRPDQNSYVLCKQWELEDAMNRFNTRGGYPASFVVMVRAWAASQH